MRPRTISGTATLASVAALVAGSAELHAAQLGPPRVVGTFYRVEAPTSDLRPTELSGVRVERFAPAHLAPPAPLTVLPLPVRIRAFTGQIIERPGRQRIYVAAVDLRGDVRLFELGLAFRQTREIRAPATAQRTYGLHAAVAPDASKIYVQWLGPGALLETDIYDGESLSWLGRTRGFVPHGRTAGFEHRPPYLWSQDAAGRLVLVDTQRDAVVRVFDRHRWFGPRRGVVADAWRDIVLLRIDAGHDRFQLVDLVSGEVGPPLDLDGYRRADARLVLAARYLVLLELGPPVISRYRRAELFTATGAAVLFDLRAGRRIEELRLVVAPDLPASALGVEADPTTPGRLWVYGPNDRQRYDSQEPGCELGRRTDGDSVRGSLTADWDGPGDPRRYRYTVTVDPASRTAAWAVALRTGRPVTAAAAPEGWGVDLIDRERWVRWTNGLGPPQENVQPGAAREGYELTAESGSRPGFVEYRIQAAAGLPRGCQSDDTFLDNSTKGYTIGPERVDTGDSDELAERLERMVRTACEHDWIEAADCDELRSAAARVTARAAAGRTEALARLDDLLARTAPGSTVVAALRDAASAVTASLGARP